MGTTQLISIEKLSQTATKYDPVLRRLPAVLLEDFVRTLHLNVKPVDVEDRIINVRRRGGLLKPYTGTVEKTNTSELLKIEESALRVHKGYIALEDNVTKYAEKGYTFQAGKRVNLNRGGHPYEFEILKSVVSTFIEDFTLAIPHAEYNAAGTSPLSVFDGFYTAIDKLIANGQIAKGEWNLIESEPMEAPKDPDDTKALEAIVKWLKQLHPNLKGNRLDIMLTPEVKTNLLAAFENKRKYVGDGTPERLALYLRDAAQLTHTPELITHHALGRGDRIVACRPGSFTVGINTNSDMKFVQVRSPFTDPNLVQFWMQMDMGTRLDDWNAKVFAVNQGTISPMENLAGDYLKDNATPVTPSPTNP